MDIMKKLLYNNWILALIPLLMVLLVASIGGIERQIFPDAGDYAVLAENFFSGFEQGTAVEPGWRTPGYPAMLSVAVRIFGKTGYLWLNLIFLYMTIVFMLYRASEWRLSRGWLIIFMGLSGGIIALSSSALSEIVFIFFLLLNIEFIRRKMPIYSGLMLAVAVAIRPAALFLWIVEIIWLIMTRCSWRKVLAFAVLANLIAGIWAVRNDCVFEHFAYTSHSGRYNYFYKVGGAISYLENRPFDEVRNELSKPLENLTPDSFERDAVAGKLAMQWILEHPAGFMHSQLLDLPRFWMPDITPLWERLGLTCGNQGTLDILRREGIAAAISHYFGNASFVVIAVSIIYTVGYGFVLVLIIIGFVKLILAGRFKALIALVLLLGYFWLLPAGNLDWRFRMVVWPILVFIALIGLPGGGVCLKRINTGVASSGNQS